MRRKRGWDRATLLKSTSGALKRVHSESNGLYHSDAFLHDRHSPIAVPTFA